MRRRILRGRQNSRGSGWSQIDSWPKTRTLSCGRTQERTGRVRTLCRQQEPEEADGTPSAAESREHEKARIGYLALRLCTGIWAEQHDYGAGPHIGAPISSGASGRLLIRMVRMNFVRSVKS